MKALVIGAGMMGSAMAYDLVHSSGAVRTLIADIDQVRARNVAKQIGGEIEAFRLDTTNLPDVVAAMRRVDVAVGATSYTHNLLLTKAAIQAGKNFCDLGGNMTVVGRQVQLDDEARRAGVLIVPNCGLAPGMACVIASGASGKFSSVDEITIRVGGLPRNPKPPLNYQLVFSPEGLINEYIEPAEVIRDGKVLTVPSMTDVEKLSFPAPYESLEAFNTSGGVSTLTRMFTGKARRLDYKTIRYPGHCELFKSMLDLGFARSESPDGSGQTNRTLFEELLRRTLPMNAPDVVLMRVTVSGTASNSPRTLAYEMVDCYDDQLRMTSMMRTTAFPTSIIARMTVDGTIPATGVMPPEACVPLDPFLAELKKRKIVINESRTAGPDR